MDGVNLAVSLGALVVSILALGFGYAKDKENSQLIGRLEAIQQRESDRVDLMLEKLTQIAGRQGGEQPDAGERE